ncbi:uncharacterized protein PWA37_001151 [Arxiozyma heterogenica]|uniref:uncharacterized protein n=1 Tax=Arxiozyma heterogenica TaxID=278026 RepID=UPI002EFBCA84
MDIAIRLHDDYEEDYVFEIQKDFTVNNYLRRIFDKDGELANILPLRPSIFHEKTPTKFYKSVHPGILTPGGSILFNFDSTKNEFLKELDSNVPLIQQLWPGQLIVPNWDVAYKNIIYYTIICFLWLYTDLPDFISPTPGNCLTNYISWALIPIMNYLNKPQLSEKLRKEIQPNFSSHNTQIIFFVLHILKILFLTLFLGLGMANPVSFNLFKIRNANKLKASKKFFIEKLYKNLGWTGLKKTPYELYKKEYYEHIMKKHGGMLGAHKIGKLKRAVNSGIILNSGEGYSTPIENTISTFKAMKENQKFILSEVYFHQLKKDLESNLNKCAGDIDSKNVLIKNYKRHGNFEGSIEIENIIQLREQLASKFYIFEQLETKKQK